jgi:hypothetical protein
MTKCKEKRKKGTRLNFSFFSDVLNFSPPLKAKSTIDVELIVLAIGHVRSAYAAAYTEPLTFATSFARNQRCASRSRERSSGPQKERKNRSVYLAVGE